MKLLSLGLDGASYELINQYVSMGLLPTFKLLIDKGLYYSLPSTNPPHTAPGWVSSLTGVNPGKHGIYQFWDTQAASYVGKYMGSSDYGAPPVWEILNRHGFSTGMINIPMSHPPQPCNGFMLTWPLSNTMRYSYPPDLIHDISVNNGHYAPDILTMFTGDLKYIEQAISITKKRLCTIQYLIRERPSDFLMAVFTEIDRVSHFYWKYVDNMEVSQGLRDAIKNIYIEIDTAIKTILDALDEDTVLLVYSDHGFQKGELDFYLHTYLEQHDLFKWKFAEESYIPQSSWFEKKSNGSLLIVDWTQTTAYMAAPGSFGININLKGRQQHGIVDVEDYHSACDYIIRVMSKVLHPHTARPLFKEILKSSEVYHGEKSVNAPDIILVPEDYKYMVHHGTNQESLFSFEPEQSGMHSQNGIMILYDKRCAYNKCKRSPANLCDIAPSILAIFGIDTPDYMDGQSIFDSKSEFMSLNTKNHNDMTYKAVNQSTYSEEEQTEIKQRLKSLGYL